MPGSKKDQPQPHDSPVDPELEARVDAMMDPYYEENSKSKDSTAEVAAESTDKADQTPPPIDIFSGSQTAPEVPAELAKELEVVSGDGAEADEPQEKVVVLSESPQVQPAAKESSPVTSPDTSLEDSETERAIDEITQTENDQSLESEDKPVQPMYVADTRAKKQKKRGLWRSKRLWWTVVAVLVIALTAVLVWPTSRYFALNMAGVRSQASMTIIDSYSGQPLKNVDVTIGDSKARTNDKGIAQFSEVKLGRQELVIKRVGFAERQRSIVLGWGSNPLGEYEIKPTGARYTFQVVDYVSGKPVSGARASSSDAVAQANDSGEIALTLHNPGDTVRVIISADEYRKTEVSFDATKTAARTVRLVPDSPVVYAALSKAGNYALFRMDVDGKHRQKLIDNIGPSLPRPGDVMVSKDGKWAGLVSKKDQGREDEKGVPLDTVTVIDLEAGAARSIDHAVAVQLLGWQGARLVYQATYTPANEESTGDGRIISYDCSDNARSLLFAAAEITNTVLVQEWLYYVARLEGGVTRFGRMTLAGEQKTTLRDGRAQDAFTALTRLSGSTLRLATEEERGVVYNTDNSTFVTDTPQATPYSYRENGAGSSAWVKTDKTAHYVQIYSYKTGQDKQLATFDTAAQAWQWLTASTVIIAVDTVDSVTLYAVSRDGEKPVRVTEALLDLSDDEAL